MAGKFGSMMIGKMFGGVVGGALSGIGAAVGGTAQGIGSAVGGALEGAGTALGGALQGAMTPAPTTIINNVGIAGQAAKKNVSGGGSIPAPKKTAVPAVNANMPTEKLLTIAVKYLSSIDKTLQDQINFERLALQQQMQAEKESVIERGGSNVFAKLGEKIGAVKDTANDKLSGAMTLAKKIIGKTALAGVGLVGLGLLTSEQSKLDELKQNWEAFQKEFAPIIELAGLLGTAAVGAKFGGVEGALAAIVIRQLDRAGVFDSIPGVGDILGNRGDATGGPTTSASGTNMAASAAVLGYGAYRAFKTAGDLRNVRTAMSAIKAKPIVAPSLSGITGARFIDPVTKRMVKTETAVKAGSWLSGKAGQSFVRFLGKRFGTSWVSKKLMPLLARVLAGVAITSTGIGAIPGALWTLVNIGLSVWTVYDLITALWDWHKEYQAEDAEATKPAAKSPDARPAIPNAPAAKAEELANLPTIPADIEKILATIRTRESGGNYGAQNPSSTASGAYQFIDGTWRALTGKYGIGTEYPKAKLAPPEIQDAVASRYVQEILAQANGDVSKVPLAWYTGNVQGKSNAVSPAEVAQYQSNWMSTYTGGKYAASSYNPQGTAGDLAGAVGNMGIEGFKTLGGFVKGIGKEAVGTRNFVPMSAQTENAAAAISKYTADLEKATIFGKTANDKAANIPSIMKSLQTASPEGKIELIDPNFNGKDTVLQYLQYHKLATPSSSAFAGVKA